MRGGRAVPQCGVYSEHNIATKSKINDHYHIVLLCRTDCCKSQQGNDRVCDNIRFNNALLMGKDNWFVPRHLYYFAFFFLLLFYSKTVTYISTHILLTYILCSPLCTLCARTAAPRRALAAVSIGRQRHASYVCILLPLLTRKYTVCVTKTYIILQYNTSGSHVRPYLHGINENEARV